MISIKHKGNFEKTDKFFKKSLNKDYLNVLQKYGQEGVRVLSSATPKDSGNTANCWGYMITRTRSGAKIEWNNSNVVNGVPIAIILQYGHGTKNGGYVQARDYINPAIRPIFDKMSSDIWREVIR